MSRQCVRDPDALAFIRGFIAEHGYSPTVREVGAALGIKGEGMPFEIISRLERHGFLKRIPNRSRNIRLVNPLEQFASDELIAELNRRNSLVSPVPAKGFARGRKSQSPPILSEALE